MNRYSSYSKVPLEWMGEIPSHWTYTKNRFGFKKWKNGKNESENTPVLSLTIKGVKIKTDLSFGKSTESYIGHQLVEKGDIVFTPRDFDQTPILSDVSKYDGCISNLYIVDKSNNTVLNHYINYYWYGLKYSVDYFKNFSHGMRSSFNRFQFDQIPLLIPPKNEQTQIVSFLNTKTQKIDGLIEQTEQKITLLKEKRTSLINHCVTKGLNPNVEMKDSGVEWIGEIPNHWVKTKLFYHLNKLTDGEHISPKFTDNGVPFISSKDLNETGINLKVNKFVSFQDSIKMRNRCNPEKGDVLIVGRGQIGKISIVDTDTSFCMLGSVILLKIKKSLSNKFVFYFLKSEKVLNQLLTTSGFSVIPMISLEGLKKLKFLLPPISEQNEIVEYLDEQTQKIDSTIEKETQRIKLLKEYRQSLISEVVTGKIDVRDWNK